MDPVVALQELSGAARWAELVAHGVSPRAVQRACDEGRVKALGSGLYCLPGAEAHPATRAVALSGVVSCSTAAEWHGLDVFGQQSVHVTLRRTPPRRSRGVVLHRREVERDTRTTTLRQTLLDCCRCLAVGPAVSVRDSAVRQGRVDADELARLVPRSGPWAARVARAVALVDPQAQSVLESAGRVLLVEGDVGPVVSQVRFAHVGWVDLLVGERLVVELDGRAVHGDTFVEDRRRDAELVRQGFVVVRFTYADVERRPAWVLQVVREALAAGHRRARER
ncbi:hypothetical protein GCM10027446_24300 [Angustibacter peucedani]